MAPGSRTSSEGCARGLVPEMLAAVRIEGCGLDSVDAELAGAWRASLGIDAFLEPGTGEDVGTKDLSLISSFMNDWSVNMMSV